LLWKCTFSTRNPSSRSITPVTCACNGVRSGHWPQPEHFEILLAQLTAPGFPLLAIGDAIEEFRVEPNGFLFEERMHYRLRNGI
jgi:hypothetical protein